MPVKFTLQIQEEEVEVYLPKFKIDYLRDLNDDLEDLGMGRMFTDDAEFPNLLEHDEELKVSKVLHKLFIEVNEDGMQAATATVFAAKRFNGFPFVTLTVLLLASVQSILSQPFDDHARSHQLEPQYSRSFDIVWPFVRQSNDFAIRLYKQVSAQNDDENMVVSPFSISACLFLLAMGADGLTREELVAGLHYDEMTPIDVVNSYRRLMNHLGIESTLNVANKIYVQQPFRVDGWFNNIAMEALRSETESVDFSQSVATAEIINDWVKRKTKNKIKNLISPDSLDSFTQMVLVNVVHFKGTWTYQFDPILTHPSPFWISETESQEVPMMYIRGRFAYNNFEEHGFSSLELTYSGSNITMLLLLPNERTGLAALEERLPNLNLVELTTQIHEEEVEVYLPKFKIDYLRDLNDDLEDLGMGRMFTDDAEFPNLLEHDEELKVSKVLHKLFIEVNEDGMQAATATDMGPPGQLGGSSDTPPKVFMADHPFIYALMYMRQSFFFMGKIVNPI